MGKLIVLCVCFCVIWGLLAVMFWNRRHPPGGMKGESREGRDWLCFFYPMAYVIHNFWRKIFPNYPEEKIQKLQQTHTGKTREELEEFFDCQRIGSILLTLLLVLGMVALSILGESGQQVLQKSYLLMRGEPGEGSRKVPLQVQTGEEKKEVTVTIPERQYNQQELEAKFTEAKTYVQQNYLGENVSPEKVTKPLNLVTQIPDSQIAIRWKLDGSGYVNADGSLNNEKLKQNAEVLLTAVLSYGEETEKVALECILYPEEHTEGELFWETWQNEVQRLEEQTAQENSLPLPQEVADEKLSYEEVHRPAWPRILLAGFILCLMLPALLDYQTEQMVMKRERELQRGYPEVVERFILLISAGLTIRGAWYRITDDYQARCKRGEYPSDYLYEEMLITRRELENGQNEATAYASFGRRLSLLQYMKFSTLLVQNLKKGSDDLLKRMDMEAVDAMRERRETAKKLGEEAGTRLLFPMMLMLIIVFAMILIAAFQNM